MTDVSEKAAAERVWAFLHSNAALCGEDVLLVSKDSLGQPTALRQSDLLALIRAVHRNG